jgi:C1A family cysteine protease
MREFLEIRNTKKLTKLSPLFVYYEERVLEGTVNEDAGAEPRDGFKTLVNLGVAPESTDKYVASKFAKAPTKTAITDALKYRISSYHSLSSLADIQSCLVSGTGVVIGFNVYESFEGDDIANTGIMPMPTSGEKIIGGHAVFVCSYFTDVTFPGGGYLVIKNSWGTSWGGPMKGYFKMPFLFVNSTNVSDMWTCSL